MLVAVAFSSQNLKVEDIINGRDHSSSLVDIEEWPGLRFVTMVLLDVAVSIAVRPKFQPSTVRSACSSVILSICTGKKLRLRDTNAKRL